MWKNLYFLFRKLIVIYQVEVRKSGTGFMPNNMAQWDVRSQNVKFNFRKKVTSFSFDLVIVSLVLGMITFLFYK